MAQSAKITYYHEVIAKYREFTENTELITSPEENDRRQNTNTMSGQERDR